VGSSFQLLERGTDGWLSATSSDPDRDVIEATLAGDTSAFGQIVERHGDVVYRVAARVVGPEDAHDVAQDSFLRAFNRLRKFRGEGSFRSWLLQITHNTALNWLSRRVPEPVGAGEEVVGAGEPEPGGREPAEHLESGERRERLEDKIRQLRPEHRLVLVLRDVEGLAYEEIAEVTETPVGSVKGRLHRARGEMVDILRNNTYDWDLPE
jgi:RNA polymerase sigma-70 factor, ECF subfamily